MGRIRTIKPEFWKSRHVGQLSLRARLAFVWTWNEADDEGRLEWDPAILRAGAFMFDDVTEAECAAVMAELVSARLLVPYASGGQSYACVRCWHEHQKIKNPSAPRCPEPGSNPTPALPQSYPSPTPALPWEGKGREGKGTEGMSSAGADVSGPAEPDADARLPLPQPADATPYAEILSAWNETAGAAGGVAKRAVPASSTAAGAKLRATIRTRWREHPDLAWWRSAFEAVARDDWSCGRVPRPDGAPYRITLDDALRPGRLDRIADKVAAGASPRVDVHAPRMRQAGDWDRNLPEMEAPRIPGLE